MIQQQPSARPTRHLVGAWLVAILTSASLAATATPGHAQSQALRRNAGKPCGTLTTGEAELVRFTSDNSHGEPAVIEGILMRPDGDGPFPAVVMLHTARGMAPPGCYGETQRLFRDWGYASLLVDSASAGVEGGGRSFAPSVRDVAADAEHAAAYLASLPAIDPTRLAVIGWSRGAMATLRVLTARRPGPQPFRAGVAYYPTCPPRIEVLAAPVILFHGDADTIASIDSCRSTEVVAPDAPAFTLVEYPGRQHRFDRLGDENYHAGDAADTFRRVRAFLRRHLE